MSSLTEILTSPAVRSQVVSDCEKLIEEEVGSKGLTGLPIKAAYAVVKAIKPGFVPEVIDHMLDDFARRLDPLYQNAVAKGEPVTAHFNGRPADVAEALLAITDERAQRAKNQTLKGAYERLRPTGKSTWKPRCLASASSSPSTLRPGPDLLAATLRPAKSFHGSLRGMVLDDAHVMRQGTASSVTFLGSFRRSQRSFS